MSYTLNEYNIELCEDGGRGADYAAHVGGEDGAPEADRPFDAADAQLLSELFELMHRTGADFTHTFRALSRHADALEAAVVYEQAVRDAADRAEAEARAREEAGTEPVKPQPPKTSKPKKSSSRRRTISPNPPGRRRRRLEADPAASVAAAGAAHQKWAARRRVRCGAAYVCLIDPPPPP